MERDGTGRGGGERYFITLRYRESSQDPTGRKRFHTVAISRERESRMGRVKCEARCPLFQE